MNTTSDYAITVVALGKTHHVSYVASLEALIKRAREIAMRNNSDVLIDRVAGGGVRRVPVGRLRFQRYKKRAVYVEA